MDFVTFIVQSYVGPVYMEWGTPVWWGWFLCFYALGDTKQKKLTPLDWGPPLHVNRVLDTLLRYVVSVTFRGAVVCYTAVFSVVTQRGGALRDNTRIFIYSSRSMQILFSS